MSMTVEHKMMTLLQVIILKDPTFGVRNSSLHYMITNMDLQIISKFCHVTKIFILNIQSGLIILKITQSKLSMNFIPHLNTIKASRFIMHDKI